MDPWRVMIVDDSAVIRGIISRALQAQPDFVVVAKAGNGEQAITLLKDNPVDVIILDIEMPVMDGLTAILPLKKIDGGAQIIMASTLTQRNADISLKAMSLGASDYLPKPSSATDGGSSVGLDEFNRLLIEKTRAYGAVARRSGVRQKIGAASAPLSITPSVRNLTKIPRLRPTPSSRPDVIAIGSSTGGPQALNKVIIKMGNNLPQPIFITQHLSPFFTASLAKSISQISNVDCVEASEGQVVRAGHYYLAPGDFHMRAARSKEGIVIRLAKDPPQNFCRPSVDPMLQSLGEVYGKRILALILTGMGQDGKAGCTTIVEGGGNVIAQDEATSVVWGMPGAVVAAGLCSLVLPVEEIGVQIRRLATGSGS